MGKIPTPPHPPPPHPAYWRVFQALHVAQHSKFQFVTGHVVIAAVMFWNLSFVYTHQLTLSAEIVSCSLTQISVQPIAWQQLSVFRHADVVKKTCCSWKPASEWERKRIWMCWWAWLVISVSQTVILTTSQPSVGFPESASKKRKIFS